MQIARPTTAGADRELAGQMRFGASGEGGDLLVPHMHPFDLALPADRVGQTVEAVADDAINPFDAGGRQRLRELIRYGRHTRSSIGLLRPKPATKSKNAK